MSKDERAKITTENMYQNYDVNYVSKLYAVNSELVKRNISILRNISFHIHENLFLNICLDSHTSFSSVYCTRYS